MVVARRRLAIIPFVLMAGGCAHAPATLQNRTEQNAPCSGYAAEWAAETGAAATFKSAYADFDAHMLSFNNNHQSGIEAALRLTYLEGMQRYASLRRYAEEAVRRLGALMPLDNDETGVLSLSGLADQIYADHIRDPGDDDQEALLRAVLARELLDAWPDAGRRTLDFLTALDMTRLLLKEKSEGKTPVTQQTLAALRDAGRTLDETYRLDFRPLLEKAIADPGADELEERLASRLSRLCAARSLCMVKGQDACLPDARQF